MRRPAPGWWIIPGAIFGVAVWLGLALSAWALVIDHGPGGGVNTRARLIEQQEAAGEHIEIRGYCASACTMQLHNSCVWPDAVLGFHGPSRRDPPLSTHNAARSSAVMAAITRPRWRSGS